MMKRFAPLLIFIAFCVLMAWPLLQGKDPVTLPSTLVGKPAPIIVNLEVSKGRPALINFFASWCLPCVEEQPVLMSVKNRVKIYGVAYKDKLSATKEFLRQHGNPYQKHVADADGRTGIEWGISGVPETFVVDAQGIVRGRHVGPMTAQDIDTLLEMAR